jgi:hypothetical protein
VDLGIERQHRCGVVGCWIGVGEAAAKRAAVAHLRITDLAAVSATTGQTCRAGRTGDVAMSVAAPISIFRPSP